MWRGCVREDHGSVPGGSPPCLRGSPKGSTAGKAASPPLSLCLGFALSIAVRSWQSFCLEVQGNDPGKAQQMGNFHCKKCMLHGCVVILPVFPCVEKGQSGWAQSWGCLREAITCMCAAPFPLPVLHPSRLASRLGHLLILLLSSECDFLLLSAECQHREVGSTVGDDMSNYQEEFTDV